MLPAGERQTKVIEPMRERLVGDADAKFRSIRELGQALLPGRMSLAEDHLPLGAIQSLPGAHAPFQRAADLAGEAGMPTLHLSQDGDRP